MRGTLPRNVFGRNSAMREELLYLRGEKKWNFSQIGRHFHVDHTTVINNLRRFAPHLLLIVAGALKDSNPPPPVPHINQKYLRMIEEDSIGKTNKGRMYKDYIRLGKARRAPIKAEISKRLKAEYEERVARRGKISFRYNDNGSLYV